MSRVRHLLPWSVAVALTLVILAAAGSPWGLSLLLGAVRVSPDAALEMIRRDRAIVLDLREAKDYQAGHIPTALTVPPEALDDYLATSAKDLPPSCPVITVCYRGRLSLLAIPVVAAAFEPSHALGRIVSLDGGMESWRNAGLGLEVGPPKGQKPASARLRTVPLSIAQKVVATLCGTVVKPVYLLIAALLIKVLGRSREPSVRMIRRSVIVFAAGEIICALDFFAAGFTPSMGFRFLDLMHGVGMIGLGMLLPWGIFLLVDERLLRLSNPDQTCLVHRFCGRCWKRAPVNCGLVRTFRFVTLVLLALSLVPLTSPLRGARVESPVFRSVVPYGLPVVNQIFEFRLYPILACLFFGLSWVVLRKGPVSVKQAQGPFFLALGLFGFALPRFFLDSAFSSSLVWSDFWEEMTELAAMAGLAFVVWVFRTQIGLGPEGGPHREDTPRETPKREGDVTECV